MFQIEYSILFRYDLMLFELSGFSNLHTKIMSNPTLFEFENNVKPHVIVLVANISVNFF